MSKTIVVIGITGNQGGSVADTYSQHPSWKIRAISRNPSGPAAREWIVKGVEMVAGDLDDVESLKSSFAGAHAIFAMTDFWTPMYEENHQLGACQQGITINEYCYNLEIQRGKNICVAAATVASLERFVYSSLSDTRRWSKGKYMFNWHFDSKAQVVEFLRTSPDMKSLFSKTSFLQVGLYVNNWKFGPFGEIQRDASGAFYHVGIGDGNRKLPFIWTRKDTGPLVKALVDAGPGKTLLGLSRFLTWREFMKIWADTLGVKLLHGGQVSVTEQEMKDMISVEFLKEEVVASHAYFAEFGYDGGDPNVLQPKDVSKFVSDMWIISLFKRVLGIEHELTSLEEYIKNEDWSKLLQNPMKVNGKN